MDVYIQSAEEHGTRENREYLGLDGLALRKAELHSAYQAFRAWPNDKRATALQEAMVRYQDGLKVAVKRGG